MGDAREEVRAEVAAEEMTTGGLEVPLPLLPLMLLLMLPSWSERRGCLSMAAHVSEGDDKPLRFTWSGAVFSTTLHYRSSCSADVLDGCAVDAGRRELCMVARPSAYGW